MNHRFFSFVIVLFLFVSISNASDLNETKQQIDLLESKVQANPQDALSYFNLGAYLYRAKRYRSAIAAYDTVVSLKSSLAPVALIYEAGIYLKFGKIDKAKAALQGVEISSLPPNLKKSALLLKNRLFLSGFAEEADISKTPNAVTPPTETKEPKASRSFSALADLSYGYNSNPQTLANTGGGNSPGDQQTQIKAHADYQIDAASDYDLKFDYAFSGIYFSHEHSSNYVYHDLTLPIAWYFDLYRVRLTPEFYFDYYGGPSFSRAIGGTIDISKKVGSSYLGFSYLHQAIHNVSSEYSYLTGAQDKVQASLQSQWSHSSTFINFYVGRLKYEDSASLESSYSLVGANAGYRYVLGHFDLNLALAYEIHLYGQAADDPFARRDYKLYDDIQLGYNLSHLWHLYFDTNHTDNRSNFNSASNDHSYLQSIYIGGFTYAF
jgi:hypothetical protein